MQISVLNHKVLDTQNAISLHNQSPKQSDELKKVEHKCATHSPSKST